MRFLNVSRRPSLLAQITLLITVVILVSTVLVCILFSAMIDEIVEKYVGKQAMTVAKLASEDKTIVKAFRNKNPSEHIQPIAEKIRKPLEQITSPSLMIKESAILIPIVAILENIPKQATKLL